MSPLLLVLDSVGIGGAPDAAAVVRDLGTRETFADVAATLGDFFRLKETWTTGTSFLPELEAAKAAPPGASK